MVKDRVEFGGFYCSTSSIEVSLEIVKEIHGIAEQILDKVTIHMESEREQLVVNLFVRRFLHAMLKDFDAFLIWVGSTDDECDADRLRAQAELRAFGNEKLSISEKIMDKIKEMQKEKQ